MYLYVGGTKVDIWARVKHHCEELQQGENEREPANFAMGT